jgi:diguanylate cyclase (GGDEF)-like protein
MIGETTLHRPLDPGLEAAPTTVWGALDSSDRDFPDLHLEPVVPIRALVVPGRSDLTELVRAALTDQLAADVAVGAAEAAGATDLVVVELAGPDPAPEVEAVHKALPDAALLVLSGPAVAAEYPALASGVDSLLELEPATLPNPYAIVAAARTALAHRAERVASHRYRRMALDLFDAIDAATCLVDGAGRIVGVNQVWRDFAVANGGDPSSTSIGSDYLEVAGAATGMDTIAIDEAAQGVRRVLSLEASRFELEYACHTSGEERWFRVQAVPLHEIRGALVSHVDVSDAKKTSLALSHLALHDGLTGLPNRTLLQDRMTRALVFAKRVELSIGVALFDLDQFKRVNESWGHQAGDDLLREVARRLEELALAVDTTSRVADDEFVAIRPGIESVVEAQTWAQQLTTVFDEPFALPSAGTSVSVTASVGLYIGRPEETPDDLLQGADVAMHAAKIDGRGRIRLYTDDLGRGVETRLRTEHELREGIAAGEFELYYQPVVDLRLRKVIGVEALLRWAHPDGIRMPDTFIPLAEDTGLIVPLGGWVVGQACRQAVAWAAEGLDLEMAVNLSARQVSHPDTIATIESALQQAGLDPKRLLVEVTESAVVEDAEAAQHSLQQVAALGARIAIDDFGTGYSSLLYLKRYPIQALKIDRTFVSGLGVSDDDDAIVASVVSLARAVGAVCIAEGVETHEQHGLLLALGCQYAQGYLFGRPVPAAELPDLTVDCDRRLQEPAPREGGGRTRRQLKVNPAVVQRIEQLHNSGASLHTIAAVLNKENAPTDHGGRWVSATVARVIASRRAG